MNLIFIINFLTRRFAHDWKLLLSIFAGILLSSMLVSGTPIFLDSLERITLNTAIDRSSQTYLNISIFTSTLPSGNDKISHADLNVKGAIERNVSEFYSGEIEYLKGGLSLIETPNRPLSKAGKEFTTRGYFHSLSELENHVHFVSGRNSESGVEGNDDSSPTPTVEVLISSHNANSLGIVIGDQLIVTPSLIDPSLVIANVVGIIEASDPLDPYWQKNHDILMRPVPVEDPPGTWSALSEHWSLGTRIKVDPREPPLHLFVKRSDMTNVIGNAFPSSFLSATWIIEVDKHGMKQFDPHELASKLSKLDADLTEELPGASVFSGTTSLLRQFERRSFFTIVPLLLLMTVMLITTFYYLAMMVSYLVQSRESDLALLRSRGASSIQLLKIYAIEGIVLVFIAIILAPLIAMAAISLTGKLPYFMDITQGSMIPTQLQWPPFWISAIAGLISLGIYVGPSMLSARVSLITQGLKTSRPPSISFFHRYYIDFLLLVIGSLVFWELNARGQIISGGLFGDVEVNEALLLAPVLMLTLISLLFMRFFPLFVKFVSGESQRITDLVTLTATGGLMAIVLLGQAQTNNMLDTSFSIVLLLGIIITLPLYKDHQQILLRLLGMLINVLLIALFIWYNSEFSGRLAFVLMLVLSFTVPMRVAYLGFQSISKNAPLWVSLCLWKMARNPLQYSWLVLLLVMVGGLGVLISTVGGTLSRSYDDRTLYETSSDFHISGFPQYLTTATQELKEKLVPALGKSQISGAIRGPGSLGANFSGQTFEVLGVNTREFHGLSWYREDFSTSSLTELIRELRPPPTNSQITIPKDSTHFGLWVKPSEVFPLMVLWAVFEDSTGKIGTASLGYTGPAEWHLKEVKLPEFLTHPVNLVSIQLYEPVNGPNGTPGWISFDNLHVTGVDGQIEMLEDFEKDELSWIALTVSPISTDSITSQSTDVMDGNKSGIFSFSKDTDQGIRGFYRNQTGGLLPAIVSNSFMAVTRTQIDQSIVVNIKGRIIPIEIVDAVGFFPSLDPQGAGFIVTDGDRLISHLNMLNPSMPVGPNELFVNINGLPYEQAKNTLEQLGSHATLKDQHEELERIRLDPLITAGWQTIILIAIGIILITSALGYVTYLLTFANRYRMEMGYLRALGISKTQMSRLIALEHVLIIIVGLTIGTATGWAMSDLMVSAVAISEDGKAIVPPYILDINLRVLAPLYGALFVIFALAIVRLIRNMSNVDLQTISRIEGT